MWIYFIFGFGTVLVGVVVGGGGVAWINGTAKPGAGIPTENPGTGFTIVFSKS